MGSAVHTHRLIHPFIFLHFPMSCIIWLKLQSEEQTRLMQLVFVYLFRQLSYVKERCDSEPEGDGVAALTSEERTRWAKVGALMFGGFK